MHEGREQRRYSRVKWGDRATVSGDHGDATGPVLDISLNGVLVAADAGLVDGAPCQVRIPLGEDPEQLIVADGHVVRRDHEALAIHFDAMELDSAAHLRRLVTYNSSDPDRIDREAVHLRLQEDEDDA